MRHAIFVWGLFSAWFSAAVAFAAQPTVVLTVDKQLARVGEPLTVSVTITTEGADGYDRLIPPQFDGFRVGAGGMTSQNVQMVNWQVRREETRVYQIVPQQEGTFEIGPAMIEIGGDQFSSGRIKIIVRGSASSSPPVPSAPDENPAPTQRDEGIFLDASASDRQVFVGQELVVVWRLYTQHDIMGYQPNQQPTMENWWVEELDSPRQLDFERTAVGGEVFYSAALQRRALFAQRPGKLTIGPLGARMRVMSGFSTAVVERTSPILTFAVLPLPVTGKPDHFPEQNVGQFEMVASLDRDEIPAGEATTLKVIVRGHGNLRQLALPDQTSFAGADDFKVYDSKITDTIQRDNGISGEKVAEILLMPKRSGKLLVPALELPYFDPLSRSYKVARTEPLSLTVVGDMPTQSTKVSSATSGTTNILGPDIRPPRSARSLTDQQRFELLTSLHVAWFALPLLLLLGLESTRVLRVRLTQETPRSRARAASRRVRARLDQARQVTSPDGVQFFSAIAAALHEQTEVSAGLIIDGMTRSQLHQKMAQLGYPEKLINTLVQLLDRADAGRFAPTALTQAEHESILRQTTTVVDEIARTRGPESRSNR